THEFTSLPGVMEDVTDIILNVKQMVVSMQDDAPKTMRLLAEGPGEVTGDLIECDSSISIHNPEKVLATLTEKREFAIEFTVQKGRGYMPASEQWNKMEEQEIGVIPVDAVFSPVLRVRYRGGHPRGPAHQLRQAGPGHLDQRHHLARHGHGGGRQDPPQAPESLRAVRLGG
ncbi:MAG: hypothetical protein EBQ99_10725, partial [Planctomycetes bacterium]|nr:hypothetical protein [Planctomycetota bacterium]